MKRIVFTTIIIFYGLSLFAQKLSIEDCQEKARNNYPLIQQFGLIEQSNSYTLSNIGKAYLPQISLAAQATYQSDVTGLPIAPEALGMNVPTLDKDQYKAAINVTQTIWDGGSVSSQRKIAKATDEVNRQNVEVNLYTLRDRVNQLFFGILLTDEQIKQMDILRANLDDNLRMARAFIENGTAMQSDLDAIQVEILSTEQRKVELQSSRRAYAEMLSALIGEAISEQTTLERPVEKGVSPLSGIERPELSLYAKQRELYEAQESNITAKNMPRLGLFAEGGYGKPGLNMLSNKFEAYAIGGIRLSWNFGNLYTQNNEKRLISLNKEMIDTQEETFIFNTRLQSTQTYNEVLKARELIERDDEIIRLRMRVMKASESKYENGVYTVNDLIKDINAESQARQSKALHEIQYLLAIEQYKTIKGEGEK